TEIAGNDVVLLVRGWSAAELESILADFSKTYSLPAGPLAAVANSHATYRAEIANSIHSDTLAFLVNYLYYPVGWRPGERQVAAIAIVGRSEALGGPRHFAASA